MRRFLLAALFNCAVAPAFAASAPLDKQFHDTVQPFVGKYCAGCHSGKTPAGGLDFKSFDTLDSVTAEYARWSLAADRLAKNEMPPKPMAAPPQELTNQIVAWVHSVKADELRRHGGDPGVVLARRLSNAEYNDTIRDLTGQDLQPARQFPVDPANTAGFDNSGESLIMSPALLNKYLQAARATADDMYLVPEGFAFAPHPMKVETDRLSYAIQQIIAFYQSQPTDYAKYFEAAWRYRHRAQLNTPKATLASIAAEMKLSPKYLGMVWGILNDKEAIGPVAKLQGMWNALPDADVAAVQTQTVAMRDWVQKLRADTAMQFAAPRVRGLPGQAQPLHNWRLEEYAQNHRGSDPAALRADNDPAPKLVEVPKFPGLHADATPRWLIVVGNARAKDTDLVYPAGQKDKYQKAFARFASVFPDTFYVSERGRYWPDNSEDQGRLLSAGYHNTAGYYRDDTALQQLILDDKGKKALDRLWFNFDFYADQTAFTWEQYYLNNAGQVDGLGAESGLPRPAKGNITDTSIIMMLRDKHLAKAKADPRNDVADAIKAINWHFALKDATIRKVEKARTAAEPVQIAALAGFAERAWRRPLTAAEKAKLIADYKMVRAKNQLSHEDAIRDSIVSILMAPDFLYRFDLGGGKMTVAAKGRAYSAQPLSNISLASRLSYFLWSSMPDAELLHHANAGDLNNPKVLLAETRRMLKDGRVQNGLATEFTGNWLGFRLFESNNSVDRERFPAFNDDLREAMFQEPIRFMQDTVSNDRPVTDLVYGDYTFVNPVLAKHYGMPAVEGGNDHWVRVDNAGRYNRGGLLPMAVFLTQNSPGLRTSPVKRGAWLVEKVLGINIPPPPPVVPELPSDEAKMDLPVREALAQHRANPLCGACHAKFDPLGMAFEGFGPVGDARAKDMAGRPVDTAFSFGGNFQGNGVAGLKDYIKANRQDVFVDNLSRKLLAFALGRSLQLSDEGLIDQMKTNLAKDGYRFRALIETIVLSPQFRDRRAALVTAATTPPPAKAGLNKINFQKGAR
ncbi:MAG: DUF1592 domain-containing protein [Alphaproteobacteria bacterium]|nr:DUF1592 domain-containing protein [Alphaproteobacteria bacterium]